MVNTMEKMIMEGSYKNPKVVLDPDSCLYEISGNSIPENALKVYEPIYNWIDQNVGDIDHTISLIFRMNHMNSASVRTIFKLINQFEKFYIIGKSIEIHWYYDADDDRDMGSIYASSTRIPFQFIKNK